VVEFGAREAELGRQPRRAREFFIQYPDRILFGTDKGIDAAMYRNHFRWPETGAEYFDYWGDRGQGRWKIYSMELPDSVLEKIYPQECPANLRTVSWSSAHARQVENREFK